MHSSSESLDVVSSLGSLTDLPVEVESMSGFLQKQTKLGFWRPRWFQVRHDGLYYAAQEHMPGGKLLKLADCQLIDPGSSSVKHGFKIVHEGGKLHLSAHSEQLKAAWWSALQRAIVEAKQHCRTQGLSRRKDFTRLGLISRGSTSKVLKVLIAWAGGVT